MSISCWNPAINSVFPLCELVYWYKICCLATFTTWSSSKWGIRSWAFRNIQDVHFMEVPVPWCLQKTSDLTGTSCSYLLYIYMEVHSSPSHNVCRTFFLGNPEKCYHTSYMEQNGNISFMSQRFSWDQKITKTKSRACNMYPCENVKRPPPISRVTIREPCGNRMFLILNCLVCKVTPRPSSTLRGTLSSLHGPQNALGSVNNPPDANYTTVNVILTTWIRKTFQVLKRWLIIVLCSAIMMTDFWRHSQAWILSWIQLLFTWPDANFL